MKSFKENFKLQVRLCSHSPSEVTSLFLKRHSGRQCLHAVVPNAARAQIIAWQKGALLRMTGIAEMGFRSLFLESLLNNDFTKIWPEISFSLVFSSLDKYYNSSKEKEKRLPAFITLKKQSRATTSGKQRPLPNASLCWSSAKLAAATRGR